MTTKKPSLTIVVPALNEAEHLSPVLDDLIATLERDGVAWQLFLINDGSRDRTGAIMVDYAKRYPGNIRVRHHDQALGIGVAFHEGLAQTDTDAIAWFPADGENHPDNIVQFLPLLSEFDIIIPYTANVKERSVLRQLLSRSYMAIIRTSFSLTLRNTNSNVIYRRSTLEGLKLTSTGFFFQTEALTKTIRKGCSYREVPIAVSPRLSGSSKALTLRSFGSVVRDFFQLLFDVYFCRQ